MADLEKLARWNGTEPTKPKSPGVMRQLAYTLDRADREREKLTDVWRSPPNDDSAIGPERASLIAREDEIQGRFRNALVAYVDAVNTRDLWHRVKLVRRKKSPLAADAFTLQAAMHRARERSHMMHDLGPDYSTSRERVEADCAASQAESLYAISQAKFQEAQRERQRDAAFNIVRVYRRRKTMELHL